MRISRLKLQEKIIMLLKTEKLEMPTFKTAFITHRSLLALIIINKTTLAAILRLHLKKRGKGQVY